MAVKEIERIKKPKKEPEAQSGPAGPTRPDGPGGPSNRPPTPEPTSNSGPVGGDDDLKRLAGMLIRIRRTFDGLVAASPRFIPSDLQPQFTLNWPQARLQLSGIIDYLQAPHGNFERRRLLLGLEPAGLTTPMLYMKDESLSYFLNHLDGQMFVESAQRNIFETAQLKPTWTDKVIDGVSTWFKPSGKVINSIIGSLLSVLPGGLEIFKEFKEHYEAACDIAEALKAGRAEE